MSSITLINPAAGQGEALKLVSEDGNYYVTSGAGDAERYTEEILKEDTAANITVCGGDGTLNEVINGVMKCQNQNVTISVVPTGTGNDFVRSGVEGRTQLCDVLKYDDRYFINILNIGLDGDVVVKASEYKLKPFIKGSFAYILGVVSCLFKKFGQRMKIELENKDGTVEYFDDEFLIFVASNGKYYGGGFKASPNSELDDGLVNVLIVKKVSRLRFISVVGDYKKGKHIDENGKVKEKFSDILVYRQCKKVRVDGVKNICVDGEIEEKDSVEISVAPQKVKIAF